MLNFNSELAGQENSHWEVFELASGKAYGGQMLSKWDKSGPLIPFSYKQGNSKIWQKLDWRVLESPIKPLVHLYELSQMMTSIKSENAISEIESMLDKESSHALDLYYLNDKEQWRWEKRFIDDSFFLKKSKLKAKSIFLGLDGLKNNDPDQKSQTELLMRIKNIDWQKARELTYFKSSKKAKALSRRLLGYLDKSLMLKGKDHKEAFSRLSQWDGVISKNEDSSQFFLNWQEQFSKNLLSYHSLEAFGSQLPWGSLLNILNHKNLSLNGEQSLQVRQRIKHLVTQSFSETLERRQGTLTKLKKNLLSFWKKQQIPSKWRNSVQALMNKASVFLMDFKEQSTSYHFTWQSNHPSQWLMRKEGCQLRNLLKKDCSYRWESSSQKKINESRVLELHPSMLSL